MNDRQKAFADYYIESGNLYESAIKAGYSQKTAKNARKNIMEKRGVPEYIAERTKPTNENRIATADEVMMFFTRVMNGEEKDAFGLDPSLQDRLNAAKELAKRTVDISGTKEEYEKDNFLDALKGDVADTFEKAGDMIET